MSVNIGASLCFSGFVVPLGVVSRGVRMEGMGVCLQEECRYLKEQVAMENVACMVILLTAKCVQVCVSVCIYVQYEAGDCSKINIFAECILGNISSQTL